MSGKSIVENVLSGESHAKNFTHDDCAYLWAKGVTHVKSGEHLEGYDNKLVHYNTLSAIRTEKGEIIVNSQDWGSGWAKTPRIPQDLVKAHLPLTTLRDNNVDVYNIEIVESKGWNDTLFKVKDNYYLLGRDEQTFIVELIKPCSTISEAYESMKPETVKLIENSKNELMVKDWPIRRQGDLFFIGNPSAVDNDPPSEIISFQQSYKKTVSANWERSASGKGYTTKEKYIWYPQIKRDSEASRHYVNKVMETPNSVGFTDLPPMIQQVSGNVRHPEHKTLKLGKGWWIVIPNVVKRSITVQPRGGRGAD